MKLYNTLSRETEEFKPIKPNIVKLYTCGPTVYDYAHIGNLRSFVFDDTLRRTLESAGFHVKHVMNITDVGHLTSDMDEGEDKLESGAERDHKSVWEVAQFYIDAFEKDAAELNILPPNAYKGNHQPYPRATDFIPEQQEIIQKLLEKGTAYQTDQAVYFDVSKLSDYGRLTRQNLADKEVAARTEVVTDAKKRNPQDFALWFFPIGRFANHSMTWESPWGKGFPGWHLECSAIIHATLGEPLDIHTGGVDHIGTHHTNEMAQTEAAFSVKLANYWVHNEYLLANGEKMSKSKGNYYTLSDIIDKGFDPKALRLLFLQAHYRSQMNFTYIALKGAQNFLRRLQAFADLKFQTRSLSKNNAALSYKDAITKMRQALEDDLNSALSLSILSDLVADSEVNGINQEGFQELLDKTDELFGLGLSDRQDITEDVKDLLVNRLEARQHNDWQLSDKLRNELKDKKIDVKDTPSGQIWQRI